MFNKTCDKIKYLISKKSSITNVINHTFGKIIIDSYNFVPFKKILTFQNVIIRIISVINEIKYKYDYNIFLEKGSYKYKWMFLYYRCYILIELTFLKDYMLIKQAHRKSVIFVIIGIL